MRQSNNNLESTTTTTEMGTELQYSNSEIHIGQNGSANTNNTNATNTSTGSTKPIIERGASWAFGETKLLLALWSQDMVQRQLTNSKRTRHVWEKIAERIREHGYDRTADQVRTRVFNMIAEYRRIMKNPTPERRKKCIFFDAIHRIYQAKDTNSLENVILTMGYMMDNQSGNICSITNDQYNFDPLDFSNIGGNGGGGDSIDQADGDGSNGDDQNNNSGSDSDERNNELLVFPLSPNSYVAANDVDDDTNFNYDESTFVPHSKRFRSNPDTTNASALLIDRMFSHLSKETEVMREWVNLERERLAQEVARRKEEKDREERREKIFLDVLNKLQERIFSVLKHHEQQSTMKQSRDQEKSQSNEPTQTPTSSSSSTSSSSNNQTDK
ncbi:hypothetical protein DERP_003781 [Dermatophagoides pteronyssinus]|uniref:Myb/SANT-like DNA-binding domain-containing protein n=1 Tax=Dermatophagoides pteronyssinus TaxID=6956 RepID=A0ABQ8JLL0_DERPT|nr:hypothetical protein DERP_003781 [Dermatophagoides pteronyssinus]